MLFVGWLKSRSRAIAVCAVIIILFSLSLFLRHTQQTKASPLIKRKRKRT